MGLTDHPWLLRIATLPGSPWRRDARLHRLLGRTASQQGEWKDAVRHWSTVLASDRDGFEHEARLRLSRALMMDDRHLDAVEVLHGSDLDTDPRLRYELARAVAAVGHHELAVETLRALPDDHPLHGDPRVALRLHKSLSALGLTSEATNVIERARDAHPRHRLVAIAWWRDAVDIGAQEIADQRANDVMSAGFGSLPADFVRSAARAARNDDRHEEAVRLLEDVRDDLDDGDAPVLLDLANSQMALQRYDAAVATWKLWVAARVREGADPVVHQLIPPHGPLMEWHRRHLAELVRSVPRGRQESNDFLLALLMAVRRAGMHELAREYLDGVRADGTWSATWESQARIVEAEAAGTDAPPSGAASFMTWLHRHCAGKLPRYRVLRAVRGSHAEVDVHRVGLWTTPRIRRAIADLAVRDRWPETFDPDENRVAATATDVARRFGARHARPPYVDADLLARAAWFPIYSELLVQQPAQRLAEEIAARHDGDSVVLIELRRSTTTYLNGHNETELGKHYLYRELVARGVPTSFVLWAADAEHLDFHVGLSLRPSPLFAGEGGQDVRWFSPDSADHAVMMSGMRNPDVVSAAIGGDVVRYAGSHVPRRFAYDRSQDTAEYDKHASIDPPTSVLPHLDFHAAPIAVHGGRSAAVLQASAEIELDLFTLLDHVLTDYVVHLRRAAEAEIRLRGLRHVHVSDHPYAESVMLAGAIKDHGGTVTLWPHSANPAHPGAWRGADVDRAVAVTVSGAKQLAAALETDVTVRSDIMLDQPTADLRHDPGEPLSVIVIGNKTQLGWMPLLDPDAYVRTYREFFAAVGDEAGLSLHYKAKGLLGETEDWLEQHVGDLGSWARTVRHPLRTSLPNPVFVSVGASSTALLEGITVGIPCLVVRDFPVLDYTTLGEDSRVPVLDADMAVKELVAWTDPEVRRTAFESQREYLRQQLAAGATT